MEIQCKLTEIPEALHLLINGNHDSQIFCRKGEIKSINIMRGIYRIYIKSYEGSGEYRYTPEEAENITVSCV